MPLTLICMRMHPSRPSVGRPLLTFVPAPSVVCLCLFFKGPMANVMRFAGGEIDKIPTSVEDAYKTMAVCDAAYRSAENLTPIKYD